MSAGQGRPLAVCARCGPAGAGRACKGRGLCASCYDRSRRDDTLLDYPTHNRSAVELATEACLLRARHGPPGVVISGSPRCPDTGRFVFPGPVRDPGGMSWPRIAEALGVSEETLAKARERTGWPDPHTGRPVRDPAEVAAERESVAA